MVACKSTRICNLDSASKAPTESAELDIGSLEKAALGKRHG